MEVKNKYAYVITQDICNKFIEVIFLWDVWFGGQIVCYNIEHPLLINKMKTVLLLSRYLPLIFLTAIMYLVLDDVILFEETK